MPYFFSTKLSPQTQSVTLSPEESHHVRRVFRKSRGETIHLTNGEGWLATAIIDSVEGKGITCRIEHLEQVPPSPSHRITIALSTIRPNRLDWAVEKLTELGIGTIQPLFCTYTTVKSFKQDHLKKIAISAIKQSEQTYLPRLLSPVPLLEWLLHPTLEKIPNRVVAHQEVTSIPLADYHPNSPLEDMVAVIGPEGGFHSTEIERLKSHDFIPVELGEQVLRTETAAIVSASLLKLNLRRKKS